MTATGAEKLLPGAVRQFEPRHVLNDPDDPLVGASSRALDAFRAVLRGYDLPAAQEDHALRTLRSSLHGYATLQAGRGFQWSADVDESFAWLVDLLDRGLRSAG